MIVRLHAMKPDQQGITIKRARATPHPHVKETRKMQGYAAITSFFLFISAGTALAEQNANQDDPPTAWPLGRQHLLAGHYVGKLHPDNVQCQAVRAELWLEAKGNKESRRYILKTVCIAPETQRSTTTTTERGPWWLDKNGDDCLILSRNDVSDLSLNPNMYGFRINEETGSKGQQASFSLAQDGNNCNSGNPLEHRDKVLRRAP
ncbi:TPA: hypothetical protein HH295_00450 [Xanthomonas vasicola pv. zeae]|uniref:Uncharacterized protein n=5 Tax=Xanthomonas vasicola TaxID=56459 RepID=A0A836ZSZ1_XANVA|nr:hypothetical protein [Xanthomonas vasicola]AZR26351.1 hypothetical protein NX80_007440 [Xanthomonas vasicola pv. arecae]KFA38217.1 hypothetical protein KWS_0109460 [Xanthomonas vasicola pv. musacearum NCPPB 4384]AVQ07546.1 hypothetical protein C7V42_13920 [Xanthomonas vasicola pv. vasculorum]AZM71745.1 hypothetical protein CXP37_13930 [Xanthomonas vasicola pv. vasculorum]AZR30550.1 hypothetical protein KWO_008405 [Xanthomonas vasicola pv. musacearum NCPPB 4379]